MSPRLLVIPAALTLAAAAPPRPPSNLAPFKTCLDNGHGLRACTWNYIDPHFGGPRAPEATDLYPWRLVVYRHGSRLYEKAGSPFIWEFGFLDGGKMLAYESGPRHFGMSCTLIIAATGREIDTQPCFTDTDIERGKPWLQRWFASPDKSQETPPKKPLDPGEQSTTP